MISKSLYIAFNRRQRRLLASLLRPLFFSCLRTAEQSSAGNLFHVSLQPHLGKLSHIQAREEQIYRSVEDPLPSALPRIATVNSFSQSTTRNCVSTLDQWICAISAQFGIARAPTRRGVNEPSLSELFLFGLGLFKFYSSSSLSQA